jgi:subtilisin family serine protease
MQRVIIKVDNKKIDNLRNQGFELSSKSARQEMSNKFRNFSGKFEKSFDNFGLIVVELPLNKVRELAKDEDIEYISPDREIVSTGHIAYTTGAGTAWYNVPNTPEAQGDGVGIAVLDSGIDEYHSLLYGSSSRTVVYNKDFTGQGTTEDKFGHGTHVASMATGNWLNSVGDRYQAVAPHAKLINLRVLGNDGTGTISNAISAINWAISNKSAHNIRVINISFGTPPKDSYTTDPLCIAARQAYNAGILVVASAGNNGRATNGTKLYGSINSPGIEPSVLTVGAANTYGTDDRMDDRVTSFSSRGPTRGYKTVSGKKVYDNLIKPDIIAPGNKLIGARSGPSNYNNTSLVNRYPSLNINSSSADNLGVMYLSGTSMAAPIASGAAAMLFQIRPDITPGMAKAILMYTAQPVQGANTLEQGTGLINIKGATEVVSLLKSNATSLSNGSSMLTGTLTNQFGNGQCSWIHYSNVCYPWGKGVITNYGFLYGDNLMKLKQGIYNNGVIMGDGTYLSGSSLLRKTNLTSSGVNVYQGVTMGDGVIMGDGSLFLNSNSLATNVLGNGVIMGDGVTMGDGVIMGDTTGGTSATTASQAIFGDNTAAMQP